jgi:hypothetical protein
MGWLSKNAEVVEAVAASVTAIMALAAIVGVGFQISANDELQAKQAARDTYRDFLRLSVEQRAVASLDYCDIQNDADRVGYEAFVEHLLYTAEQVISYEESWTGEMDGLLGEHASYMCARTDWEFYIPEVAALIDRTIERHCAIQAPC